MPKTPPKANDEGVNCADQLEKAKEAIIAQQQFIEQMMTKPTTFGTVIAVEVLPDKDSSGKDVQRRFVDVLSNGSLTRFGCDDAKAQVGSKVEISQEAGGIVRIDTPVPNLFGQIVTVKTLLDNKLVEVNSGEQEGTTRIVRSFVAEDLKEGDRVSLDTTGYLIVKVLPPLPPVVTVTPNISRIGWTDIGGHAAAKEAIEQAVIWPQTHAELLTAYGQRPSKGILFYGPPGCGKTMLAKATATALADASNGNAPGFFSVRGPELLNAYVGETERAIRELFKAAREHTAQHGTRAVVFVDEADSCLGPRGMQLHFDICVPAFLVEMDGISDVHAPLVILATNRAADLDEAIVREGRIDRRIEIKRPEPDDVRDLFTLYLKKRPTVASIDQLASRGALAMERSALWNDRSGAMVAALVDRATGMAMARDIAAKAKKPTGITLENLGDAIIEAAESRQLRSSL